MNWNDKMKEGMKIIKEACKEAHNTQQWCEACPFGMYCDAITIDYYSEPFKWRINDEDN